MAENKQELLKSFLSEERFKKENIQNLKIEDYTGTGDKRKDFTYWVEIKLDKLGGIKGGSSFKFGVYKCNNKPETRDGYSFDENNMYAWVEKYGATYEVAYKTIIQRITEVINAASKESGVDYDAIQNVKLGDAFKWKIAFLYSNNRLVPVYQAQALETAARRLGLRKGKNENTTIAALQQVLMEYYKSHTKDFDNVYTFGGYVWTIGSSDLSQSNQIIKYGAPGTGKTYTAKKEAEEFFNIWKLETGISSLNFADHYEFVQFHPSYSYEDFIEGIKPIVIRDNNTELRLKNGIFKSFCKKAARYELWLLNNSLLNDKSLDEVKVKDVKNVKKGEDYPFILPKIDPDDSIDDDLITKYIPPYFFVIDEINRADLSRVFGELMYCLEYRGYEGRIKTQYSELETDDTIFYEDKKGGKENNRYFFIPNNIFIIGTMNTIDRSIESFDFALRRRFQWQRIDPSQIVLQNYFNDNDKQVFGDFIIPLWNKLNKSIDKNPLLGPDYQIGHSYLMKLKKYQDCATPKAYRDIIWHKHIQPVLEEYFRGMGAEAKTQIRELRDVFCANPTPKKGSQKANGSTPMNDEES